MKLIKTYSFTLREILAELDGGEVDGGFFWGTNFKSEIQGVFGSSLADKLFADSPAFKSIGGTYAINTNAAKVLNKVSQIFKNRDSIYTSDDGTIADPAEQTLTAALNILNGTYSRYSAILDAYDATLVHLMDKIEETGTAENAVADMPQTGFPSGTDFGSYSSALTKTNTTRETDRDTPAERLSGLDKIENILRDWADEFRAIFA